MITFLHTADWQLGLKLNFIQGDKGALQREARFEALDRIVALAGEREVDFVLVAGDAFDDNAVSDRTVRQALQRLNKLAPKPVYLLPGNHDALTPDSVYRRDAFTSEADEHIRVLHDTQPIHLADGRGVLLPCPLTQRHEVGDPTAHLTDDADDARVRMAIAHGSVIDFEGETNNLIDPACVERARLDYLALGDWHGTVCIGPRVWYPGTPEQTRFKEQEAGNVLVVSIEKPGAEPVVEPVRVAQTRWLEHTVDLSSHDDLDALAAWYEALAAPSRTLLDLRLRGTLGLADRRRLQDLIERQDDLLRWQRVDDQELLLAPSQEDLDEIATAGFVQTAVERLRDEAGSSDAETAADADAALLLLYRLGHKAGEA